MQSGNQTWLARKSPQLFWDVNGKIIELNEGISSKPCLITDGYQLGIINWGYWDNWGNWENGWFLSAYTNIHVLISYFILYTYIGICVYRIDFHIIGMFTLHKKHINRDMIHIIINDILFDYCIIGDNRGSHPTFDWGYWILCWDMCVPKVHIGTINHQIKYPIGTNGIFKWWITNI